MLKIFLMLSMINLNVSNEYVAVDAIEYYQTRDENKKVIFDFNSDYYNNHEITVTMELYKSKDNFLMRKYKNSIRVIGKKVSVANLNFELNENMYILIFVEYNQKIILDKAKINFYVQDDCLINKENLTCKRIYKSEYKNKISQDLVNNFIINNQIFDKYLIHNFLDVSEISFYTDYTFAGDNKYLIVYNYIDEYSIYYDDGYMFLLDLIGEKRNSLSLVENYHVDLINFDFSETSFVDSIETNKIHFPFFREERVYQGSIIIESFIKIQIDFNVMTMGNLLGDCKDSKYCLVRRKL